MALEDTWGGAVEVVCLEGTLGWRGMPGGGEVCMEIGAISDWGDIVITRSPG